MRSCNPKTQLRWKNNNSTITQYNQKEEVCITLGYEFAYSCCRYSDKTTLQQQSFWDLNANLCSQPTVQSARWKFKHIAANWAELCTETTPRHPQTCQLSSEFPPCQCSTVSEHLRAALQPASLLAGFATGPTSSLLWRSHPGSVNWMWHHRKATEVHRINFLQTCWFKL